MQSQIYIVEASNEIAYFLEELSQINIVQASNEITYDLQGPEHSRVRLTLSTRRMRSRTACRRGENEVESD